MTLLGLVRSALECFDVLAWPLFALLYPLYSSIRAIETNSFADTHKLNTYWVVFSFILLFEHAFTRLLEWFVLWPYIKLLIVFFLVMPHFDGALYVYKHLIFPCLSMDPQIVINWFNKRKASFLRDNFLSEVERYVKENGTEDLEKIIASKSSRTNLDVKEFNAVSSIDKEMSQSINPNGGQNDIKAVQAAAKKKETTASQVSQAEPNLTVNVDNFISTKMNEIGIEVPAEREILKIPPPMEGQKEWTSISSLPTQTQATFSSPLDDNKHKATYETLEIKNEAEPKLIWTENHTVPAMEINEKQVEVESSIEYPESPKEVQKEWTCALCQASTTCGSNLNGHLQGRKHKAACKALKIKNEALEIKNEAESKLIWTENRTVAAMEINEKKVEVESGIAYQESSKEVPKEWTCALCQVSTTCESNFNGHLQGRKHKTACEALKIKNEALKITNEPEPKLISDENCTLAVMEICEKRVEGGKGIEDPESAREVPKEWTCALCQVSTTCENNFNGHLQGRKHKAACEALKIKNEALKITDEAEPKLILAENYTVAAMEICEKRVEVGTGIDNPESPKEVQREWTCALCQVTTPSERDLDSHLHGRKHKAVYEALKARNQAFVPKIAPALTAKPGNQPNMEPGKSIPSSGPKLKMCEAKKLVVHLQSQRSYINPKRI